MRNSVIAALLAVAVSAALAANSGTTPPKKPLAKPPATKPAVAKPAATRPAVAKLAATRPATTRPAAKPATGVKAVNKGEYPAFEAEEYTLTFQQMDNRSKVDLAERGTKEHSVKLDGKLTAPKDEDAVAVTKELTVSAIVDDEKNTMLLPKITSKTASAGGGSTPKGLQEYQMNTYTAFPLQNGSAEVEVPTTKIKRSPYMIQEMELKATVILAEERTDKVMPAVIMETPDHVVPGLGLRITTLQLSPTFELTIVVKCDRGRGGPAGPFVEQAWVLDENNEVIGGGRWTQGDPFGKSGTLTIKINLPKGKNHKSIKFVTCTKYSRKPLTFTVKDIFQR
jgi:hypothetical protein